MRNAQRKGMQLLGGLAAAALMVTAATTMAPAAALDEPTCTQFKRDLAELEGAGARENMAKGAAWGKANLKPNQLDQVKKLIEADEALAFRCARPRLPPVAGKPKVKVPVKAVQKTQPGENGKTAAAPKAKSKAAADGTPQATAGVALAPKPRPKAPAAKPAPPAE